MIHQLSLKSSTPDAAPAVDRAAKCAPHCLGQAGMSKRLRICVGPRMPSERDVRPRLPNGTVFVKTLRLGRALRDSGRVGVRCEF